MTSGPVFETSRSVVNVVLSQLGLFVEYNSAKSLPWPVRALMQPVDMSQQINLACRSLGYSNVVSVVDPGLLEVEVLEQSIVDLVDIISVIHSVLGDTAECKGLVDVLKVVPSSEMQNGRGVRQAEHLECPGVTLA